MEKTGNGQIEKDLENKFQAKVVGSIPGQGTYQNQPMSA